MWFGGIFMRQNRIYGLSNIYGIAVPCEWDIVVNYQCNMSQISPFQYSPEN